MSGGRLSNRGSRISSCPRGFSMGLRTTVMGEEEDELRDIMVMTSLKLIESFLQCCNVMYLCFLKTIDTNRHAVVKMKTNGQVSGEAKIY